MNFQQLRYVRETVRQGLNLTEAANVLYTSQPGVSKQIREFEDELGVTIFERRGKRFVALTEPGKRILEIVERVLQDVDNLRRVGTEYAQEDAGRLTIATTHTQARYALPRVVAEFRKLYPKVHLHLQQGDPRSVAQMVIRGDAELGIATEALDQYPELVTLPGYQWRHCLVVPPGHPLLELAQPTLADLARYPIVTYSPEFTGRTHIDAAFAARGLAIDVVLTAIDSDVIKTYVELGMGVGIIAAMAFDPERDRGLRMIDGTHLFRVNTTRVALRKGAFLRAFTFDFIERFAPPLRRKAVEQALAGESAVGADAGAYQI
jgi:LysR family cys regulon transcriptional activator